MDSGSDSPLSGRGPKAHRVSPQRAGKGGYAANHAALMMGAPMGAPGLLGGPLGGLGPFGPGEMGSRLQALAGEPGMADLPPGLLQTLGQPPAVGGMDWLAAGSLTNMAMGARGAPPPPLPPALPPAAPGGPLGVVGCAGGGTGWLLVLAVCCRGLLCVLSSGRTLLLWGCAADCSVHRPSLCLPLQRCRRTSWRCCRLRCSSRCSSRAPVCWMVLWWPSCSSWRRSLHRPQRRSLRSQLASTLAACSAARRQRWSRSHHTGSHRGLQRHCRLRWRLSLPACSCSSSSSSRRQPWVLRQAVCLCCGRSRCLHPSPSHLRLLPLWQLLQRAATKLHCWWHWRRAWASAMKSWRGR